jgi:hypothetical protein
MRGLPRRPASQRCQDDGDCGLAAFTAAAAAPHLYRWNLHTYKGTVRCPNATQGAWNETAGGMGQIFRPGADAPARVVLAGIAVVPVLAVGMATTLWRSPYATAQDVTCEQPAPFSHEHHVGGLGIDCRYCHTSVEKAAFAGIPPTETCMSCHSQIWTSAPMLALVRLAASPWRSPRRELRKSCSAALLRGASPPPPPSASPFWS